MEQFPTNSLVPSAHLNAGFSFYQLGQFEQAIQQFDQAARDKRQAARANYWKGISYKARGDFGQAGQALRAAYEADPKSDVAESALFYWADCELRARRYEAGKKLFLQLVREWPHGEFADDSLHFAAEAALLAGSTDEAERLVEQFNKDYPRSPLALHEEILLGRVLNAKAAELLKRADAAGEDANRQLAEKTRRSAISHLENVVSQSHLPRTVALARFHLGRTYDDAGQYARAIEVLAPLVGDAGKPQATAEAVESLFLAGHAEHVLGKHDAAVGTLSRYLAVHPIGEQAEQALADRALSNEALSHRALATADVTELLKQAPHNPLGLETLRRLAELAYDVRDWGVAAELFEKMARLGAAESDAKRMGLSGLGWTQFQMKRYVEAAGSFAQVFAHFSPRISQVAEAGYMPPARCMRQESCPKRPRLTRKHSRSSFPPLPPDRAKRTAVPPSMPFCRACRRPIFSPNSNAMTRPMRLIVWSSNGSRKRKKLGQILFDWANVLYVSAPQTDANAKEANPKDPQRRQRVHEMLSRVIREYPGTPAHDNAQLFLAELDLMEGKTTGAEKSIRELLADPKIDSKVREDGLFRLLGLAADKEDWSNVRPLAERFLAEFPNSADARLVRMHLGSARLGLKDAAGAEKILEPLKEELSVDKRPPAEWWARVWIMLAESLYKQRKYAGVQATVDDLHGRMPKNPFSYQADEILGRSFKNQAQWDKAISAFERVIEDRQGEQNETAAKSQLMIAECRFLQKDFRRAREDYLKVYTLYDRLPEWARRPCIKLRSVKSN